MWDTVDATKTQRSDVRGVEDKMDDGAVEKAPMLLGSKQTGPWTGADAAAGRRRSSKSGFTGLTMKPKPSHYYFMETLGLGERKGKAEMTSVDRQNHASMAYWVWAAGSHSSNIYCNLKTVVVHRRACLHCQRLQSQ